MSDDTRTPTPQPPYPRPYDADGFCPHGRHYVAPCGDCVEDEHGPNDPWGPPATTPEPAPELPAACERCVPRNPCCSHNHDPGDPPCGCCGWAPVVVAPAGATPAPAYDPASDDLIAPRLHDDREATHPADEHYARAAAAVPAPVADDLPARLAALIERIDSHIDGSHADIRDLYRQADQHRDELLAGLREAAAAIDQLRPNGICRRCKGHGYLDDRGGEQNCDLCHGSGDTLYPELRKQLRDLEIEAGREIGRLMTERDAARARVSALTTAIEAAIGAVVGYRRGVGCLYDIEGPLRAAVSPTPEEATDG